MRKYGKSRDYTPELDAVIAYSETKLAYQQIVQSTQ